MTTKNNLYVYRVKFGNKRSKKIKLKKFINAVNNNSFSQKFFINEKDAKEFIKNAWSYYNYRDCGNYLLFN